MKCYKGVPVCLQVKNSSCFTEMLCFHEMHHNVQYIITDAKQPSGGKFKWGQIIIMVLEKASDNEMSLKKLRKKVGY